MPVQVSISDLLGTAMTAAKVAVMEIDLIREKTERAWQRTQPFDRAIAELTQALAETIIARQYAESRDPLDERVHFFDSSVEYAELRIRNAISVFES